MIADDLYCKQRVKLVFLSLNSLKKLGFKVSSFKLVDPLSKLSSILHLLVCLFPLKCTSANIKTFI